MSINDVCNSFYLKSIKAIETSQALIEMGDYSASISRSYYAMYYMLEALFIAKDLKSKTHSGKITMFRKEFILTRIFDNSLADSISQNFNDRMIGDYEGLENFDETSALNDLEKAKYFAEAIAQYLIQNKFIQKI
jgi:uncharacterized protein (UPF0332 family)